MAITTKQQRQQRRSEALQLIADGMPPTDAATRLTVKWGCSRRTSLRDIELAQSELANALNSVELQHMVGWLATRQRPKQNLPVLHFVANSLTPNLGPSLFI